MVLARFLMMVGLAACAGSTPSTSKGLRGDTCASDSECTAGLICFDTRCRAICNRSSDCDQLSEHCEAGVCLPGSVIECGNGLVEPTEACDDGDDQTQDGCSPFCQIEPDWECAGSPSRCNRLCGNGREDVGEECDDDNQTSDDGCSTACAEEGGYECTGWPSECLTDCGDGTVAGDETCDDGDEGLNDGCPSGPLGTCRTAICGDGFLWTVGASEACDDGDGDSLDGCDSACDIESGFECVGEPSVCTCTSGFIPGPTGCVAGCASDPCGAHASCDDTSGAVVCTCNPFWSGAACDGCRVYVDIGATGAGDGSTWTDAFTDVQGAIDHAESVLQGTGAACEVWVAEGAYVIYRGSVADTVAMRSNVHLVGGFAAGETDRSARAIAAHPTVLDGFDPGLDGRRCRHVVRNVSDTVLDGFIIQNGDAQNAHLGGGVENVGVTNSIIANCLLRDHRGETLGGAVAVTESSAVSIRSCDFDGNSVSQEGGALVVDDSTVLVEDSTFFTNSSGVRGGAIAIRGSGAAIIARSTFVDNEASGDNDSVGGAIVVYEDSSLELSESIFVGNRVLGSGNNQGGGAIGFSSGGASSIHRSVFAGNYAERRGAAIVSYQTALLVQNCALVGNAAEWGTALYAWDQPPVGRVTVLGSTVALNRPNPSSGDDAVVSRGGAQPLLLDSLLWRNDGDDFAGYLGGEVRLEYTLFNSCGFCDTGPGVLPGVDPEVRPPPSPSGGTWSADPAFDSATRTTVFTAAGSGWGAGELAGLYVDVDTGGSLAFPIVNNTADTLVVLGNRAADAASGATFELIDLRLSGTSPAIDAGQHQDGLVDDLVGQVRVQATVTPPSGVEGEPSYPDMGCYEFAD